ncbi:hypothetical protein [Corallococcus sp. M7]
MFFAPKVFPAWGSLSHAARSLYGWTFYTVPLALLTLFSPATFLTVAGMQPDPADPHHFAVRMFGSLLTSLSFMSHQAAVREIRPFFHWAVIGRTFITGVVLICTALGQCPPIMAFFACIDFGGGMWTFVGLKRDAAEAARGAQPALAHPTP